MSSLLRWGRSFVKHAESSLKQRILEAADSLARDVGPGHISLEAVAARAGVSKGGLLYHFPSKENLLEALVEHHLQVFDDALTARQTESAGAPNSVTEAFLDLFMREYERKQPPPSGLMMVLAENPGLLEPVRHYNRIFLDRMKENASDPNLATVVFLALHGMRNMQLLNVDVLDAEEVDTFIRYVRKLIERTAQ